MRGRGFEPTRILLLLGFFVLALGGFALGDASILSAGNLTSMAVFAVEIGIVALGQTLVICGGEGGIDLSVGAIAALAQVCLGLLLLAHIPWPFAVLSALVSGVMMGVVNALAVTRFGIPPIIVTLATMFAFNGFALVFTGGINIDLTSMSPSFLALGQGSVLGLPLQLVVVYLPLLLLFVFLQHFTLFGRALYLAGTSELAARLAGIRTARLRGWTYVMSGLFSSLAGVIGAARLGTARPDAAEQMNLVSIAIVVLGGTGIFGGDGSVIGTAVATAVIAVIDYGLSYNDINPIYQAGVMGMVLITLVLVENAVRGRGSLPRSWWRKSKATARDQASGS
jgi:ribose transport system permease protein